jgi:peptide subunit release factor 1 (eRF1)
VATTIVNPTLKDVQWLADRPSGEGQIVSCYADTSVSSGVRPLWREHLKNEVRRIDESLAADPAARDLFHRNIDAIERLLSSRRAVGARGMAVFAAVQNGLVHGYALAVAVPNRLVMDEEPYLVPLLELLDCQRRYLVVHTDTHRGRLYTVVPGAAHLIEAISEEVPKRHRASGELWGKQQATIARHREDHVLHYFKEMVREIERAWPEERYDGIVLLGEHEVLQELRRLLPDHLARQVVREAPHAFVGRQVRLESKIAAMHADAVVEHDRRLLEEVKRRLLERHLIVGGPQEVIDAVRNSQVGYPGSIVMEPDRGEVAWHCRGCGALFAHSQTDCPFCGARCGRTSLWQAIALLAARHNIPLHVVGPGTGLEKQGGVVALLARAEPWSAPPEATLAAALPEARA